jgi:hypothetical protein
MIITGVIGCVIVLALYNSIACTVTGLRSEAPQFSKYGVDGRDINSGPLSP